MIEGEPDLRDLYGSCSVAATGCVCLQTGWKGRMCPHWTPLGPGTQQELKDKQLEVIGKRFAARITT